MNEIDVLECFRKSQVFDESSRDYEKFITEYAHKHSSREDIRVLESIMKKGGEYAYEAFYCVATIHRHNKDFSKLRDLIVEAESREDFEGHISLAHIRTMYEVHSESLYDYDQLLKSAHLSACQFYKNSGYQHTFANAFATICENCTPEDQEDIIKTWCEAALFCVERAIELEPEYAKYYCTKARIMAIKGRFEDAGMLIIKAIDLEDSSKSDYAVLLGNYQYYRTMIALRKQQWLLASQFSAPSFPLPGSEEKLDGALKTNCNSMRPYVFVSYSHSDFQSVSALLNKMLKWGLNVWYDGELKPGDDWVEEIGRKVLSCEVFVLMLSNRSMLSKNVRNEITLAQNHKCRIVPVFLEDVELSPGAELQLQGYHHLFFSKMSPASFEAKLLENLSMCQIRSAEQDTSIPILKFNSSGERVDFGRLHIEEQFSESKTGNPEDSEDVVVVSDNYIAVIDGATSKNNNRFNGKRGGKIAADFIAGMLQNGLLEQHIDGRTAIYRIQAALQAFARKNRLEETGIHLCASAVIYSVNRRQIWSVGDCQFILNKEKFSFPKKVDTILSETRSLVMHMLLASGLTETDLRKHDEARGLILDELKMQKYLENSDDEYGYSVFSSLGQVRSFFVKDVPAGSEVVLASDGYPELFNSLQKSEERLNEILRQDPLCYKQYKSTKGLIEGYPHFDDRSYIRFRVD